MEKRRSIIEITRDIQRARKIIGATARERGEYVGGFILSLIAFDNDKNEVIEREEWDGQSVVQLIDFMIANAKSQAVEFSVEVEADLYDSRKSFIEGDWNIDKLYEEVMI